MARMKRGTVSTDRTAFVLAMGVPRYSALAEAALIDDLSVEISL